MREPASSPCCLTLRGVRSQELLESYLEGLLNRRTLDASTRHQLTSQLAALYLGRISATTASSQPPTRPHIFYGGDLNHDYFRPKQLRKGAGWLDLLEPFSNTPRKNFTSEKTFYLHKLHCLLAYVQSHGHNHPTLLCLGSMMLLGWISMLCIKPLMTLTNQ